MNRPSEVTSLRSTHTSTQEGSSGCNIILESLCPATNTQLRSAPLWGALSPLWYLSCHVFLSSLTCFAFHYPWILSHTSC